MDHECCYLLHVSMDWYMKLASFFGPEAMHHILSKLNYNMGAMPYCAHSQNTESTLKGYLHCQHQLLFLV